MYTYLNISNYQDESDHFLKSFIEKESKFLEVSNGKVNNMKTLAKEGSCAQTENLLKTKWSSLEVYEGNKNFKFNAKQTYDNLFNAIDSDMDGWITFYDFGHMMQITYLFSHFDGYLKGRLPAGELYEKFSKYSDFPLVSYRIRERAKIFNEYPQDLYVDLYSAVLTLKITDLFLGKVRRVDNSLVTEIELKHVLSTVNRRSVPDAYLNRCLRGTSKDNLPMYDWECAFVQAEISTLTYLESSFDRLTVSKSKIALKNTVFYNIDPSLPQQGSIPGEEKHHGYEIKY